MTTTTTTMPMAMGPMGPLERLQQTQGVATFDDLDAAVMFVRAADGGGRLLLLPGDGSRPEVSDVSVVALELHDQFPTLAIGVARVDLSGEAAAREQFSVTAFPTLLFVKDGAVVKTLSRMQSWSTYAAAASRVVASS